MTRPTGPRVASFAEVEAVPDPLERARMVGEVIAEYDRRVQVLGRLRAEAIEQVAQQREIPYSAIARELGLTRGRLSQIRSRWIKPPRAASPEEEQAPLPLEWGPSSSVEASRDVPENPLVHYSVSL